MHTCDNAALLSPGKKTSGYNLCSTVSYGIRLSLISCPEITLFTNSALSLLSLSLLPFHSELPNKSLA